MSKVEKPRENEKTEAFYLKGRNTGSETPPTATHHSEMDLIHRNATSSPLLRLPPEIRNMIYMLVLGCKVLSIHYNFDSHNLKGQNHKKTRFPLDLLKVCRQIHMETALLPYMFCRFRFSSCWYGRMAMISFLRARTKEQMAALRLVSESNHKGLITETGVTWLKRLYGKKWGHALPN